MSGRYTAAELCALTGVSPRTLTRWRATGFLPPAVGRTRAAYYTDEDRALIEARLPPYRAVAAAVGVSPDTVKWWRRQGLLPPFPGTRAGARATEAHVAAARRILEARRANKTLADLRAEFRARYPYAFGEAA